MLENTRGGVSILTVAATDGDSGVNAEIAYSIVPSSLVPPGLPPTIVVDDYFIVSKLRK